jgi:hypothetical protein
VATLRQLTFLLINFDAGNSRSHHMSGDCSAEIDKRSATRAVAS